LQPRGKQVGDLAKIQNLIADADSNRSLPVSNAKHAVGQVLDWKDSFGLICRIKPTRQRSFMGMVDLSHYFDAFEFRFDQSRVVWNQVKNRFPISASWKSHPDA
jgi:hypothetical protein